MRNVVMKLRLDHVVLRVSQVHQVSLAGITDEISKKSSLHIGTVNIACILVIAPLFGV